VKPSRGKTGLWTANKRREDRIVRYEIADEKGRIRQEILGFHHGSKKFPHRAGVLYLGPWRKEIRVPRRLGKRGWILWCEEGTEGFVNQAHTNPH